MWRFQQIEPQPARGKLTESMWDDPDYIAEEKYDGDRRIAQFCGQVVRFTGRRKSVDGSGFVEKTLNVPHLSGAWPKKAHWIKDLPAHVQPPANLDGTVLDGETIFTLSEAARAYGIQAGGMSKYVTSIMGSLPEEAVRKQIERGWLRYVVFDCLWFEGQDVRSAPLYKRRQYASAAVEAWGNHFASLALAFRGHAGRGTKRLFFDSVMERGGEGVILKRLDHVYGDKQGWVKVKGEWTADVVIMGFIPAKEVSKKVSGEVSMTKYAKAGLIGAIQCGQYMTSEIWKGARLAEVATVSGMTDDLRLRFTRKPEVYTGKVIEIAHNGREPTGRFRHPRFKRFRDDKAAKDCIYREGEI